MTTASITMPRKPKRNDLVVKMDADVVHMARIVAAYEDMQLAELLSEIVRPVVSQRLQKHQDEKKKNKER